MGITALSSAGNNRRCHGACNATTVPERTAVNIDGLPTPEEHAVAGNNGRLLRQQSHHDADVVVAALLLRTLKERTRGHVAVVVGSKAAACRRDGLGIADYIPQTVARKNQHIIVRAQLHTDELWHSAQSSPLCIGLVCRVTQCTRHAQVPVQITVFTDCCIGVVRKDALQLNGARGLVVSCECTCCVDGGAVKDSNGIASTMATPVVAC